MSLEQQAKNQNGNSSTAVDSRGNSTAPSNNIDVTSKELERNLGTLDEFDMGSFNDDRHDLDVGEASTEEQIISQIDNGVQTPNDNVSVNETNPPALSTEEKDPRIRVDEVQKRIFEEEKEQILATVPSSVKKRFGEIMYSTFGTYIGPVLVLNPYHNIGPGPVRDQWLKMYNGCKTAGRLANMSNLIYWYGGYENPEAAYSFLPTNKLMDIETGQKKVKKKLDRIEKKSKITNSDEVLLKGMMEMEDDLKLDRSIRMGYMDRNFLEVYEHAVELEEALSPEPESPTQPISLAKKKSKKKSSIKRRLADAGGASDDLIQEPKKKKQKRDSSKPDNYDLAVPTTTKKKKKKDITENKKDRESSAGDSGSAVTTHPQQKTSEIGAKSEDRLSAYDEFILATAEVESHGDTDDEDIDAGGLATDDDAMDENNIMENKSPQNHSKSKDAQRMSQKTTVKKKGTKLKVKIEKRQKGEKKALSEESKRRAEQRRFELCEQKYSPIIRRWEKALSNKDADQVSRIYIELLEVLENFTAPFIEVYEISSLMKESKRIINNNQRKELLGKLKTQYDAMRVDVPVGFTAEKSSVRKDLPLESKQKKSNTVKLPKSKSKSSEQVDDPKLDEKHVPAVSESQQSKSSSVHRSASKSQNLDSGTSLLPPTKLDQQPSQRSSRKPASLGGKAEKKKFSLGNLMRPASTTPQEKTSESRPQKESPLISLPSPIPTIKIPSWMTQLNDQASDLKDENRLLAFEFLQQGVGYIPASDPVCHDAVARQIELAIHCWAHTDAPQKDFVLVNGHGKSHAKPPVEKYWNKVHALVAGISGKRQIGTIAKMLAEGKFNSPTDLLKVSEENLWRSFQGESLTGI